MNENEGAERVYDVEIARAGADAEKRTRDLLGKHRVRPEVKNGLLKEAESKANQQMAAYAASVGKELHDTRVRELRETASRTIILSSQNRKLFEKSPYFYDPTKEAPEFVQKVDGLLKLLGQGVLDRVIAAKRMSQQTKLERVKQIGDYMNRGVDLGFRDRTCWTEDVVESYRKTGGENEDIANVLRGYLAVKMVMEDDRAVTALVEIGKLRKRGPERTLRENMWLIREQRQKIKPLAKENFLDKGMSKYGFVWSQDSNTYVKVPETTSTHPSI